MRKKKNISKEMNDVLCGLTTFTAIAHAISFFLIVGLLVYACFNNLVYLLVLAILVGLLNIPIWNLGSRADKLRFVF